MLTIICKEWVMKIKLTTDLPINKKHGAKKGKVFEVTKTNKRKHYFTGDDGNECAAYYNECEEVEEPEPNIGEGEL